MTRPQEFTQERIVRHDTQYRVDERFTKGPHAGTGVLTTGRVVWTERTSDPADATSTIHAFAEGIDIVAVEAHSLMA